MQLIVDGLLTDYERVGVGPLLLILPGWADTSVSWQQVQKQLANRFDVVVINLPGFGRSQTPPDAWGLDEYVAHIAAFLAKLDAGNPQAIVGHSNGGSLAIRGLATGKLSADKLVLLASAGIRGERSSQNLFLKYIAKTGKVLTAPLPKSTKAKLRRRLYAASGSDMLVAEHLQESFKKIVATDVRVDAENIKLPTLLIYGDQDNATPLSYGQMYHERIQGSRLEVLNGAGHFVQLDQPERVMALIGEFV